MIARLSRSFSSIATTASHLRSSEIAVGDFVQFFRANRQHRGIVLEADKSKLSVICTDGNTQVAFTPTVTLRQSQPFGQMSALNDYLIALKRASTDADRMNIKLSRLTSTAYDKLYASGGREFGLMDDIMPLMISLPKPQYSLDDTIAAFNVVAADSLHFEFVPASALEDSEGGGRFILRSREEIEWIEKLINVVNLRDTSFVQFERVVKRLLRSQKVDDKELQEWARYGKDYSFALMHSALHDNPAQQSPYLPVIAPLLRNLFYIADSIGAERLLTDISVLLPWDFKEAFSHHVSHDAFRRNKKEASLLNSCNASTTTSLADDMQSIRHNFGQLACWTLDNLDTPDVDDGLSMEPCHDDPTSMWIHVHVADPTVLVKPGTAHWKYALSRVSTMYLSEYTNPMMVDSITRQFSLEPSRPNMTLTVSSKISATGQLLDYKIRPGVVENVKKVSYDQLDDSFDRWNESQSSLTVDYRNSMWHYDPVRPSTPRNVADSLDGEKANFIQSLRILESYRKNRLQRYPDSLIPALTKFELKVTPGLVPLSTSSIFPARPYEAVPKVEVLMDLVPESIARNMVMEAMILAGSVVATHAKSNSIPIVYRSQVSMLDSLAGTDDLAKAQLILDEHPDKVIHPSKALELIRFFSRSELHAEPQPHSLLGLEQYCQATSPIRRASDLVNQWQIKQSLIGSDNSRLSGETIQTLTPIMTLKDQRLRTLQRTNRAHWARVYFSERVNESPVYDAYISALGEDNRFAHVFIKQTGSTANVQTSNMRTPTVGKWIKIRPFHNVDLRRSKQSRSHVNSLQFE
eukprot:Partr_v1_DN26638_c0_g1_i1_m69463 putative DIS3 mitotic control homolog (S